MIKAPQLLSDLTRLLKRLEEDLLRRIDEVAELKTSLQAEWQAARDADRTAETFETWVDQVITQAGVHWLLSCVFLRFIEDNKLVDRPWLSGTTGSGDLALARDRHEAYFRANPLHSDREYLLECFREAGALPGLHTFFDERHNPVFRLGISGDAAMAVRQFWQQVDPNTGALTHDFTDPTWNTRFLGDLYQDLSEATRKRYALLQTPEFVEEFILDRTLTPAIREFGYQTASLIDPTCGSGHFLLGAFHRFIAEWQRAEPSRNRRDIAQKALDAVAGVDLNPFAIAISRFRLLVAALLASDVQLLSEAPDYKINVAIGDSLLHGKRFGMTSTEGMFEDATDYAQTGLAHAYASEDLSKVNLILGRQYHAVVGNPPYIVVKDAVLNRTYRNAYASCHMKYSLGCPFTERFFDLAFTGADATKAAGYVGLITTNSFMKREFGSKLIEDVLPRLDLSHVVDSSGAWIPGHNRDGTATVILFGRHRPPMEINPIRTVMGIRSEPGTPDNPACGLVWRAIIEQIDKPGSESDFISVADNPRRNFSKHPWSIGGGGTAELKDAIEHAASEKLSDASEEIGVFGISAADEVLLSDLASFKRSDIEKFALRPVLSGDELRDWQGIPGAIAIFPYLNGQLIKLSDAPRLNYWLWNYRTFLGSRTTFARQTYFQEGRPWWEWHQVTLRRIATPLTITFAEVATHNNFVLDYGGNVFKQTAPVIKLSKTKTETEHLNLLGLLNSSVACFWLKQVCFPKDGQGQMWEERFAFNATNVGELPLCSGRPAESASRMQALLQILHKLKPTNLLASAIPPNRAELDAAHDSYSRTLQQMIAVQEEIDWRCYHLYKLLPANVNIMDIEYDGSVEVKLGERAFEIVLARRISAGKETSNWFDRHGSTPTTNIPTHWPEAYQRVVQRRIDLIENDSTLRLVEQPLYKRRWTTPKWVDLEHSALRGWLLDRLESENLWTASPDNPPQIITTSRLADKMQNDAQFMQVAALYSGHTHFDLAQLVSSLVTDESVPFLPSLRYSDSGLRKRSQWEDTWELQRREDKSENIGIIPVPPKYKREDFIKVAFWDLRGGLDVPKERWVSYPGCERGSDTSLPISWAGWNNLQQATALAAFYLEMKESEGWESGRLQPLLAGLLNLVPLLEQWHNEVDPAYGERMGTYYKGFVTEEARANGFTLDHLRSWRPAVSTTRRRNRSTV